jgi:hypothetical protein
MENMQGERANHRSINIKGALLPEKKTIKLSVNMNSHIKACLKNLKKSSYLVTLSLLLFIIMLNKIVKK